MPDKYVQYGCGWHSAEGWENFDASPTLFFEKIPFFGRFLNKNDKRFPKNVKFGDIVKGLPVKAGSCKGVYCSHVLEHLSLEDFRIALKNTSGILSSGGIFRLVLPDLQFLANQYLKNLSSPDASLIFMRETHLGFEKRQRGLKGLIISWLGNSAHLWMWDYISIQNELKNAGFNKIRKAHFNDSEDLKFAEVEQLGRWEDCLGVQCVNI